MQICLHVELWKDLFDFEASFRAREHTLRSRRAEVRPRWPIVETTPDKLPPKSIITVALSGRRRKKGMSAGHRPRKKNSSFVSLKLVFGTLHQHGLGPS